MKWAIALVLSLLIVLDDEILSKSLIITNIIVTITVITSLL